jgi:hypothetical protein
MNEFEKINSHYQDHFLEMRKQTIYNKNAALE